MEQQSTLPANLAVDLSLAEWFDLPEGERGELIGGRLVEEEVPDFVHEVLVAFLIRIFGNWIVPSGGIVAGSEAKYAVSEDRGRKPDLTVFFPGSRLPPRRGLIQVPPDIAVEVVSPTPRDGRRDRVEKMADYAGFGIRYYWIVDPELRSLEIHELGPDGRYVFALGASEGKLNDLPGCEGLAMELEVLWAEIDRLEPETDSDG